MRAGRRVAWLGAADVVLALVLAALLIVLLARGEDPPPVEPAFDDWVEAIDDGDCARYEQLTTAGFRDELESGGRAGPSREYDCRGWRESDSGSGTLEELRLDEVDVDGTEATIVVTGRYVAEYAPEDFVDWADVRLDVELEVVDGEWIFTDVEVVELD